MDEKLHYARDVLFEWSFFILRESDTVLHLKSKLSEKFQRFNAIEKSVKMMKQSWILTKPIKAKSFLDIKEYADI